MTSTLRYEAVQNPTISFARRYKDPIFTRHEIRPYVTNNQASLFKARQIRINPAMSTSLNT
jgi:hypothetical protein